MQVVRQHAGFTLVEVMIAIVVLTIIALGLASLTVSTIRGNVVSRQMTTATTLAQDKLEQVKRLGYLNANNAIGTEAYGAIPNFPGFRRVTEVAPDAPTTAVKTVTVTVYWASNARSLTMKSMVAE